MLYSVVSCARWHIRTHAHTCMRAHTRTHKVAADGALFVHYDDGDKGWAQRAANGRTYGYLTCHFILSHTVIYHYIHTIIYSYMLHTGRHCCISRDMPFHTVAHRNIKGTGAGYEAVLSNDHSEANPSPSKHNCLSPAKLRRRLQRRRAVTSDSDDDDNVRTASLILGMPRVETSACTADHYRC